MTPQLFVSQKSPQLVYFISHFLTHAVSFHEVQIFAWDILEEWNSIDCNKQQQPCDNESVFWHLLYLLQSENEDSLLNDPALKTQLTKCSQYLIQDNSSVPSGCVGVRP